MLHRVFKYTDHEGNEQEIDAYFNLSKNDCIDLDHAFKEQGGLIQYLTHLIKISKENPNMEPDDDFLRFVRVLVSKAYGIRPKDDPSLFLKEDDYGRPYARKFRGTPAYDNFCFDLLTGKEPLSDFTDNILPEMDEDQRAEAQKVLLEQGVDIRELSEAVVPTEA